ncbi:DivIVA domain-containing protein [Desulfurispirillum indicum]|uniref:DivIVA domain-containing protein n=1 Tax=Desulfurispirillum indicum TaxID=936456 RepID=UPI001CFBD07F|nr:DivIVA domain-containing protein [Desulfurispirillum indicum]UCZ56834.1 DivIVA domain-containing protein [Desulfurispirillum indicum]
MEPAIPEFETSFRGYDKEQVEAYITDLQEKIIQLNQQNKEIQERLDAIVGDEKMLKSTLFQAQRFSDNAKKEAEEHKKAILQEASQLQKKLRDEIEQKRQFMEQGLHEMMNRYSSALKELKFVFNSGVVFTEQMESKFKRLCTETKTETSLEDETRFALVDSDLSAAKAQDEDVLPDDLSADLDRALEAIDAIEALEELEQTAVYDPPASETPSNPISASDEGEYSEEELDRFLRSLRDGENEKR